MESRPLSTKNTLRGIHAHVQCVTSLIKTQLLQIYRGMNLCSTNQHHIVKFLVLIWLLQKTSIQKLKVPTLFQSSQGLSMHLYRSLVCSLCRILRAYIEKINLVCKAKAYTSNILPVSFHHQWTEESAGTPHQLAGCRHPYHQGPLTFSCHRISDDHWLPLWCLFILVHSQPSSILQTHNTLIVVGNFSPKNYIILYEGAIAILC